MLPPFGFSAVLTQWQFAPVVTVLAVVFAGLYAWGIVRVAQRHPARPWPAWRSGLFYTGLAVLVVATESGIGTYDDLLFYDHMVQHLLLLMVAPALLIVGQPLTLLLHASRNPLHRWTLKVLRSPVASFLSWPVFGAVLYSVAVLAAHLTILATYVEQNQVAHDAEHAVFVIVGYLFLLPILGREPIRWRLSYPVRFVALVLLMPIDTFTGIALGYGSAHSPGIPTGPRPGWALSPVADLHLGGAIMWVGGDLLMFVLMMFVFLMWARDDRATLSAGFFERARQANLASLLASRPAGEAGSQAGPSAPGGPQAGRASADPVGAAVAESRGTIDDDEHLEAYNAYLARLNQHPPAGRR